MTREDILRRLADEFGDSAARVLDRQHAIAREPGGAEAVAEAVGLEPICDCCDCEGCASKQRVVAAEKEPGT